MKTKILKLQISLLNKRYNGEIVIQTVDSIDTCYVRSIYKRIEDIPNGYERVYFGAISYIEDLLLMLRTISTLPLSYEEYKNEKDKVTEELIRELSPETTWGLYEEYCKECISEIPYLVMTGYHRPTMMSFEEYKQSPHFYQDYNKTYPNHIRYDYLVEKLILN